MDDSLLGPDEERLANLYVASWQLHGTMNLSEVVAVILEILLNLVGADRMVFYVHDEERSIFESVHEHGTGGDVPATFEAGEGRLGEAVAAGKPVEFEDGGPPLVLPLTLGQRTVAAVVVYTLLPQKAGFGRLDRELFDLLSRQGAGAIYGAFLAGASSHTLTTDVFRARMEHLGD